MNVNTIHMRATIYLENTSDDHNKFYLMEQTGKDTWTATYGAIGTNGTTKDYDNRKWDEKYLEKIKRGYVKKNIPSKFIKIVPPTKKIINKEHFKIVRELLNELVALLRRTTILKKLVLGKEDVLKLKDIELRLGEGDSLSPDEMIYLNGVYKELKFFNKNLKIKETKKDVKTNS